VASVQRALQRRRAAAHCGHDHWQIRGRSAASYVAVDHRCAAVHRLPVMTLWPHFSTRQSKEHVSCLHIFTHMTNSSCDDFITAILNVALPGACVLLARTDTCDRQVPCLANSLDEGLIFCYDCMTTILNMALVPCLHILTHVANERHGLPTTLTSSLCQLRHAHIAHGKINLCMAALDSA